MKLLLSHPVGRRPVFLGMYLGLTVPLMAAFPAGLMVPMALVVLYDGFVLFAAYRWAAYPMEGPMLALMALNPVDLARILVLVALDASALMGYTGAVFQDFFGGSTGILVAVGSLMLWIATPALLAMRAFGRKDF